MTVRVLLFGHYRDTAPPDGAVTLDLPEGATVADIAARLAERDARLAPLLTRTRVAVAAEFAAPETVVRDGDEVAFLPPMSGG
jgi:molybdopterin converting factor small subunit